MTMNIEHPRKAATDAPERRRRSYGVPTALAAGLIALALFFGGLLGFLISNQTNGYRSQLETAQARIAELEGQLGTTSVDTGSDAGSDWDFETGAVDSFADFGDLADATAVHGRRIVLEQRQPARGNADGYRRVGGRRGI